MTHNLTSARNVRKIYLFMQRAVLCALVVFVTLAPNGSPKIAAARSAVFRYANHLALAAGSPLPIYHLTSIPVNRDVTTSLSQVFNGIYDRTNFTVQEDSYLNYSRFTGLNEKLNTILEQFSATGGYYAFEPNRAFGDGSVVPNPVFDPAQAQMLACQFILQHVQILGPKTDDLQIPGLSVQCDHNFTTDPLYNISNETLSGQSTTPGAQTTNTMIRIMVKMPILVNTGKYIQTPTIPFGGPGGHISMIFDDTNPNSTGGSLDSNITGLQAVAMPAYGRSLVFDRLAPSADPAVVRDQVIQRVKDTFPDGSNIQVPDPALEYYVTDAAQPQILLEPDLIFSGVSVDVGGQTLVLKDIVLPAVQSGPGGLGPTVTILSPQSGNAYFPGNPVSLEGSISDGQPPYSYDWQLDDGTSLGGGTLDSPGNLPPKTASLPSPDSKGSPGDLTVWLVVTDNEGVTRQQAVSLVSPMSVFIPMLTTKWTVQSGNPSNANALTAARSATNAVNYRFGVEYGSDYPPYGPGGSDLGGVPPDANGLSSGLMGMGWPRVFNWYNSLAWERDWRDCALAGSDCSYGVDRADYVYYSGHGSYGGLSIPSNSHDSSWFDGINARYQNARWVGFSSCLTLRAQWSTPGEEPIRRWFNAFQGAHMLLGFNSTMADIAFGPRLVDNMRLPTFLFIEFPWAQRTIAEAWVQTAFEMNAGKPAYIYATSATVDPSGNKLPKVGDPLLPRPYPVNWFYWVWWDE